MFLFFPNLINPDRCEKLTTDVMKLMEEKKLRYEADEYHYKNSYGMGRIESHEELLHELTPLIKEKTGMAEIVAENSYARIYYSGATLNKHVDRVGLDLTMSICTFSNLDIDWPLFVEVKPGEVKQFITQPGDGALILGTKMEHWREPLICESNQLVVQSFYHWRIVHAHKLFI